MVWLTQLNLPQFLIFLLVLTRVSGVVITAPVFGTNICRCRFGPCCPSRWPC